MERILEFSKHAENFKNAFLKFPHASLTLYFLIFNNLRYSLTVNPPSEIPPIPPFVLLY